MRPTYEAYVNFARKPATLDWVLRDAPSVVSFYRFRDTTGTDATDDYSGIDGVYTGGYTLGVASALAYDADEDRAVELNGSTGYVTIADDARQDVADSFTIAVSVYRDAAGVKGYICQKGTGALGIYIGTDNKVYLEKVGTGTIIATTATVPATTWTRITVTKSGNSYARIAINGIDKSDSGTYVDRTCVATSSAFVWGRSAAPGDYFDGKLDEAVVASAPWGRADVAKDAIAAIYGEIGLAMDSIGQSGKGLVRGLVTGNGRNRDLTGDQVGQSRLTCRGDTHYFNPERNLAPNPGFEAGLHDIDVAALGSVVAAGADVQLIDDPASGNYAAKVTAANANEGFWFPIPGTFANNETLTIRVKLKSLSGSTSVECGLSSQGTPANIAESNSTITGGYVEYTATLTLTADRDDIAGWVRATAAATFEVDDIQVNRGSSAHDYVDGPSWWMLQPGSLVVVTGATGGSTEPVAAGHIEEYDSQTRPTRTSLLFQDLFADLETAIALNLNQKTHRDARIGILNEAIRVVSGGYDNKCINGDFVAGTTVGWAATTGSLSTNADSALSGDSLVVAGDVVAVYNKDGTTVPMSFHASRPVLLSFYAKLVGSADTLVISFGRYHATTPDYVTVQTGTALRPAVSGSWQRYSVPYVVDSDTSALHVKLSWTSGNAAKGGYISNVMIQDGHTLRDWRAFGNPYGTRLYDWLFEVVPSPEIAVGWEQGWHNHHGNPEAVTNTTGWATTASGFITGGDATVVRNTGTLGDFGTSLTLTNTSTFHAHTHGARYRMSGKTFYSGRTYHCRVYVGSATSLGTEEIGIGDSDNPTDLATQSVSGATEGWRLLTWVPSADRTTVEFFFRSQNPSTTTSNITLTGVMVYEAPTAGASARSYARAGFQSPDALISTSSISAVDDSTLGHKVVEVVTRAVAGSGVFVRAAVPFVDDTQYTFNIRIYAPSGSGSVVIGAGDPYGLSAATSASRTVALTATPKTLAITVTADRSDLTSGAGVGVWIAAASASAVTLRIAYPQVFIGPRVQDWAHAYARGIDVADTDEVTGVQINGPALAALRDANVSMATHWVEPRKSWPYMRYMTHARQSRATKAIDSTVADAAEIYNLRRRRSQTYQQVKVFHSEATTDPVIESAAQAYRDRAGTVREITINTGNWCRSVGTAITIAQAMLAKYQNALLLPTIELSDDSTILTRQPGDRVELNVSDQKLSGLSVSVLNRRVSVVEGTGGLLTKAQYDCEEWVLP